VYPDKKSLASKTKPARESLEHPVVIDDQMRRRLARLADALIPAGTEQLSGSEGGVAGPLLDEVLTMRPDILPDIANALHEVGNEDPEQSLNGLKETSPRLFDLLTATVVTAYFMHPDARRDLDPTEGRGAQRSPDEFDDEVRDLLEPVRRRGYIYRRVPR
jgi:hypothetical protein